MLTVYMQCGELRFATKWHCWQLRFATKWHCWQHTSSTRPCERAFLVVRVHATVTWDVIPPSIYKCRSTKFCEDQGIWEITLLPSLNIAAPMVSHFLIGEQLASGDENVSWNGTNFETSWSGTNFEPGRDTFHGSEGVRRLYLTCDLLGLCYGTSKRGNTSKLITTRERKC
jgi:hypothetical protein